MDIAAVAPKLTVASTASVTECGTDNQQNY